MNKINRKIITNSWAIMMALGFFVFLGSSCASKKGAGAKETVSTEYARPSAESLYDSKTGGIGLGTLERIHFDFDQSTISDEAAQILKNNAETLQKTPSMRVLIEGHCDERGTNEYNIALGERRAKITLDYIVSLGVGRSRLEVKSWGEERPLDPSSSKASYSLNRRAEFVILSK